MVVYSSLFELNTYIEEENERQDESSFLINYNLVMHLKFLENLDESLYES